ncbi:hypothetical protein [Azospirillum lipoferum]|uniref:Bacteriophage tail tape measure N-terminal domain-containing protein n=1 Tax=Azospirillum lipoferum (strain 4B) TaxID=862719 RepID=G7Z7R3_AZOL4|nr:hypothetical protein [Azospirillum lipoferum]CBS87028.1 protein of unknown function; putative coiled-coil domains [Azospirillum lipoferum 4B]
MAGRNVTARFAVEADVAQAKRDLEAVTQQIDQLGKTRVDGARQELEQLNASTSKLSAGYTALTEDQRKAYQQREQDAQQVDKLRRTYKTLEGALETLDVQVKNGWRSMEEAARLQPQLAAAYTRTGQAARQAGADIQAGAAATKMAAAAQDAAGESAGRLRGVMGNLGYQIQDVAVQAQMGTNAFIIMAQQGPQIAGAFGPAGAAIGALIAVASVAAGVIFGMGKSADDAETAFTSYAKAMELAAKVSGELATASGTVRTAMEAERRSVIAAREEVLRKAEADLVAAQAAETNARNDLGARRALGAGTLDDVVETRRKRVAELRKELLVLRGTYGEFNDGARTAAETTGQAAGSTKSLAEQTEKLRESLRGQIKDLGVQVDTFDRSNAAKLRAKLQTEAMTAAGVSDYRAVDAGTRTLIDQAVARQEQIDTLEKQKKAQEEATRAAEQGAGEAERQTKQHAKTIEQADKYIDRLKSEADALGLSERERFVANKAMEFELQNRGKLSGAEMDAYLAKVKEEAGALYDSTEARNAKAKADVEALRALEKYQQDVTRVATDIGKDISQNLWDQITGEAKAGDALQFFKNWAKRLGVEMLNQNIVLPITMQIVGSMPSLFGIQAPAGAAGAATNGLTGSLTNTALSKAGGWAMDKLGLSNITGNIMNTPLWGSAVSMSSVGGGATVIGTANPIIGASTGAIQAGSLNAANGIVNAGNTAALNASYSGTASGAAGTAGGTLSGVLGAAGAGAFGGGLVGGALGTATNSKLVGGLSGAAAGAGAGYLSSLMGLGAMGGPWGIAISAVVGAIMGMLGTQKATVGPTVSSGINRSADGKSVTSGGYLTDNGGDIAEAQKLGDAIALTVNAALLGGGSLTRDLGIGRTANKGLYVSGSLPYREFGDDVAAMYRYALLDSGTLKDAGASTTKAIRNSKAKDFEEAAKDIALGAAIDAGNTALAALDKSLASFTKSAKEATADAMKPMLEEFERAKKLDLGAEYVSAATDQLKAYLDQLRNPVDFTQREQEMAALTGQFAAIREAVVQLKPEMAAYTDQIEAETRARIKSNAENDANRALNAALGRDYVNSINDLVSARDINARNLAAVGADTARAAEIFDASLRGVLEGLSSSDLDVVATLFTGSVRDLAVSMRDAAAASDAAAAAAERTAYAADLNARMQAAVGNARGAGLIALDAQQAAALATASGYDTTQLQQVQAAERALQAFKLAQADVLAAYDQQITAQQDYIASLTDGAVKLAQSAREFRSAYDALALNDNSPLNAKDRLEEARRQFGTALTTYRDVASAAEDRDAAKQTLLSLGPSLVQLAKGFLGSTSTTDYDYVRSVFAELGDTTALGVDTAEQQLKAANETLKEMQRQRADAARLGERQYGALVGLKDVMDQSFAYWQGTLGPLLARTGANDNRPHYSAPAAVQSAWDGLSSEQQFGVARAMGWGGQVDEAFNIWLATSGTRAAAFEGNVTSIAGGARYGAPGDIQAAWDALSGNQQAAAVRAAGYDSGIDAGLNAWVKLGHQAAFEAAIRAQAHAAGVPGFAAGTLSTPPGAVWVGEQGPELLWQGGAAAVASSVDSLRIARAFEAANDRWSGNVTPLRSAGASTVNTRGIEQRLDRAIAVLERVVEAIDSGNDEALPALKTLARQAARSPEPLGRRVAGVR